MQQRHRKFPNEPVTNADTQTAAVSGRVPDAHTAESVVWVYQGHCYVTAANDEVLSTVLGSCIAVCMRDPQLGIGGMNHFLLPAKANINTPIPGAELRYGAAAVECLTNALIARGACRSRIEVKVFGGANILSVGNNLGHNNADFIEDYLTSERLNVVAKSLRGSRARRVRYHPGTGQALVHEGGTPRDQQLAVREVDTASELAKTRLRSRIELFKN